MSKFIICKDYLKNEIIRFHKLDARKERKEKEIYINCAINVAKNLRSMTSLNTIKTLFETEYGRIVALGKWLNDQIEKDYMEENVIEKLEKRNNKIKYLKYLYDKAIKYPKSETKEEIKLNFEMNKSEKKEEMTLSDIVYRYYRYKENDPITLLDAKGFQFLDLIKDKNFIITEENKSSLVTAHCQSGKTFLVIPVVLLYLSLGFTPVMVVLDKSQVKQLIRRLKTYCVQLKSYLKSLNLFEEEELCVFNPNFLYYDSTTKIDKDDDRLPKALSGESPKIIIVIKHYQHLLRINNCVTESTKLCLLADEAQVSCCYKNIDTETYHDENVKYDNEFIKLRNTSRKYIPVSATVQDIVMVDRSLYSDNIVYIPVSEYYTGISDWIWKDLSNEEENDYVRIIEELSMQKPIKRYDRRHDKENYHPIICLLKTERKKEKHLMMAESMIQNNISITVREGNWCTIVEHGEGFYIHHSSIMEKEIKIENQNSIIKSGTEIDKKIKATTKMHYFSSNKKDSIDISDIMQYLADKGIKRFERILIISYDICKEAISFSSHHDKEDNYHLTHGIFQLGASTTVANAIQTMSRLNGNHGDNIRPVVYTNIKLRKMVLKGFHVHDQQIKKLLSISKEGNISVRERCSEFLEEKFEVYDNHVSSKYNKVKGLSMNIIENPNRKNEEKCLKVKELDSINYLYQIKPEDYEKDKERIGELYRTTMIFGDEKVSNSDDEIYYLFDSDILNRKTDQYRVIEEIIKQLIDNNLINCNLLRKKVIDLVMKSQYFMKSNDQIIKGHLDMGILPKMTKFSSIVGNGLFYWKENNRYYFRLNI